jgi:arsenate reductase
MGCGDACPMARADRRVEWNIPDPKHMGTAEFNGVRGLIEMKVRELISELNG